MVLTRYLEETLIRRCRHSWRKRKVLSKRTNELVEIEICIKCNEKVV